MTLEQSQNKMRLSLWAIGMLITIGFVTLSPGYAQAQGRPPCGLATLNGLYVFDASGYNITALDEHKPKAIVEFLDIKGDGTLTSLATRSVDGTVTRGIVGTGSYTVAADCTGTLTFNPQGPHFDIFVAPSGNQFDQVQTDPMTVLAGTSRRLSR